MNGGQSAEWRWDGWWRAAWRWLSHDFFKASVMLFSLTMAGSLLNVACRMVLGRMLTADQYGEMETMMQMLAYAGVPLAAIQVVVAREVAQARGAGDTGRIGDIVYAVGLQMCAYALVGMVVFVALAPVVRDFFRFNSAWPVYATAAVIASSMLTTTVFGVLQGERRFGGFGLSSLTGPVARVGLSWALIRPGFGATGALAAHAGANLIMSVTGVWFVWDLIRKRSRRRVGMARLYRFVAPAMAVMWVASVFAGLDMFIVKRYFPGVAAGEYAQVMAIVRLSLYMTGTLSVILFPWVAGEQAGGRATRHLLFRGMAAGLALAVGVAVLFTLFPGLMLRVFYREVTGDMTALARRMSWALVPSGLLMLAIQYKMARQEYRFFWWLAPAAAGYAALLMACRHSVETLVAGMGAGLLAILIALTVTIARSAGGQSAPRRQATTSNPSPSSE